jgi:hypothetical protein
VTTRAEATERRTAERMVAGVGLVELGELVRDE